MQSEWYSTISKSAFCFRQKILKIVLYSAIFSVMPEIRIPKNSNLHQAKRGKNDEFYTQLADIENELRHYKEHFRGKTVLCNCDDPRVSNFFRYFQMNFETLGLKRVITTCYKNQNPDLFSQNNSERAVYMIYDGDQNRDKKLNPEEVQVLPLQGNGDFRSVECIALLKQADIVVTNPPFSLFREYVAQLIEHEKKFLILGWINAIKHKDIFPWIKDNKLWVGYGFNASVVFDTPYKNTLEANIKFVRSKGYFGENFVKVPWICWYTNLEIQKRHEELILYKKYKVEDYSKYDNYDAINVDKVADIPYDYEGKMGVPITFLDKYNPEQFEILDALNRYSVLDSEGNNEDIRLRHSHACNINGEAVYSRLIIRKRK